MKLKYVCPVCNKEFEDLFEYANHVKAHADEERKIKSELDRKRKEEEKKEAFKKVEESLDIAVKAIDDYMDTIHDYDDKYGSFIEEKYGVGYSPLGETLRKLFG